MSYDYTFWLRYFRVVDRFLQLLEIPFFSHSMAVEVVTWSGAHSPFFSLARGAEEEGALITCVL